MSVKEVNEKKEVTTAEFIAFMVCILLWYLDKQFQSNIFDGVDLGNLSDTKAQVLALAASYREVSDDNPNMIIFAGGFIYFFRKTQKMFYTWKTKE